MVYHPTTEGRGRKAGLEAWLSAPSSRKQQFTSGSRRERLGGSYQWRAWPGTGRGLGGPWRGFS